MPSLVGTMIRISSAIACVNILADWGVSGANPLSCTGSSGGGCIGDTVRWMAS